ncbi:uroporphyrinogen-III C-methyltransferase, partial [Phenylobacterium sp.]|uniref:uroporphyrinogen-III C-methyltransferase n=1 Tax=Phenylobacterium sp. TaxID=1871053 RepID=UPI002F3FE5F9
ALAADPVGTSADAGAADQAAGALPGVALVGAGPGDPELITVRGRRLLHRADVVVVDRLAPQLLLDQLGDDVTVVDAAKFPRGAQVGQDAITRAILDHALAGRYVVRLKGGDPFVFGRGGEELEACREAGVECRVVPGVTAAFAAAAAAGAPLTHRGQAQAVTFVTGHAARGEVPELDWPALARPNQTVVVYMGLSTAGLIAGRLMDAGRDPATPALIVENASRADERRRTTTLGGLAAAAAGLTGPALLVVGEAMALAQAGDAESGLDAAANLAMGARRRSEGEGRS